jgi:hypothetical protein
MLTDRFPTTKEGGNDKQQQQQPKKNTITAGPVCPSSAEQSRNSSYTQDVIVTHTHTEKNA